MLGRDVKAIMKGQILTEIACTKVNATLLSSLQIGNEMSPTPIFRVSFANESRLAQYTSEGYLRWGLKGLTPHMSKNVRIFVIQGKTFCFKNGILLNKLPKVNKLGFQSTSIVPDPVNWDESTLLNELSAVSDPNNFQNMFHMLQSILGITSEHLIANGIDQKRLKKFLTAPMTKNDHLNFVKEIKDFFHPKIPNIIKKLALFSSLICISLIILLISYICCGIIIKAILNSSRTTTDVNEGV